MISEVFVVSCGGDYTDGISIYWHDKDTYKHKGITSYK